MCRNLIAFPNTRTTTLGAGSIGTTSRGSKLGNLPPPTAFEIRACAQGRGSGVGECDQVTTHLPTEQSLAPRFMYFCPIIVGSLGARRKKIEKIAKVVAILGVVFRLPK